MLFDVDKVRTFSKSQVLRAMGKGNDKLYYLCCKELVKMNSYEANMASVGKEKSMEIWHRRLDHAGNTKTQSAIKSKAVPKDCINRITA